MKTDLKLFSAFHKPFQLPHASFVEPMHAGKKLAEHPLGLPGDDTGEHISERNAFYSELTLLYWIWKNYPRERTIYWGLVHYRRYFCTPGFIGKLTGKQVYRFAPADDVNHVLTPKLVDAISEKLQDNDLILPMPIKSYSRGTKQANIATLYCQKHRSADWQIAMEVILELYPSYKKSMHLFGDNKMSFFNMMVSSWPVWEAYREWLFSILFEVERRIIIPEDPYQARVFSFLSERLLHLYVHHNRLSIAFLPVASFDATGNTTITSLATGEV
jgi:Domain of unknown function (DUF4422)